MLNKRTKSQVNKTPKKVITKKKPKKDDTKQPKIDKAFLKVAADQLAQQQQNLPPQAQQPVVVDLVTPDQSIEESVEESMDEEPAQVQVPAGPSPAELARQLLAQQPPFGSLADLDAFVTQHPEAVAALLDPPDGEGAKALAEAARRVVPDLPHELFVAGLGGPLLWRVIGRALNLRSTQPVEMYAEAAACVLDVPAGKDRPAPIEAINQAVIAAEGDTWFRSGFQEMVAKHTAQGVYAKPARVRAAPVKNVGGHAGWWDYQKAAKRHIKALFQRRRQELAPGYQKTLADMAKDPTLKDDRRRDRLADMLFCLDPERFCVATLQEGRDIALFANHNASMLGVSFDRLLTASRLTGAARDQAVAELMPFLLQGSKDRAKFDKTHRRLLKTLDYLAETESAHGRMRVKVITPEEAGIHAEMQAATVAKAMPGGGGRLGISKMCCLQCWVTLTKGDPKLFDRALVTHTNTYRWPPPALLNDPEVLWRLFDLDAAEPYSSGDDTALIKKAIQQGATSALVNAYHYWKDAAADTGYLSSGDEGEDAGDDPHAAAYQDYLSREEALTKKKGVTLVQQVKK